MATSASSLTTPQARPAPNRPQSAAARVSHTSNAAPPTHRPAPALHFRRVLVTGAAGLVGQTVAAGLAAEGHAVRAHDIRPLAEVNAELAAAMAEVQQGDLADMEGALEAVRGVDAVVHLGGSPGVQEELRALLCR